MGGSKVDRGNLGAWVVKCKPETFDLDGFVAAGKSIGSWSVVDNYRSGLMEHGDQVLLWVSGSGKNLGRRGFRGRGWLTGEVVDDVDLAVDESEVEAETPDFWQDRDARDRVTHWAPMDLEVWDSVVPESTVVANRALRGIEVVQARQMSNPSWVSATELAALDRILPPPPPQPKGRRQGPAETPALRAAVEQAAIKAVTAHYRRLRYAVVSVERDKCGWDLTCTARNGVVHRVEVKGTFRTGPSVVLTPNEYRAAETEQNWRLAVVTSALGTAEVTVHSAEDALANAVPSQYRVQLA